MFWPTRPDFASNIPLSAWWYAGLSATNQNTLVCGTTGTAIICRVQSILRDALAPPWIGLGGEYRNRPLVTGWLDQHTLGALWAYAMRAANLSDEQAMAYSLSVWDCAAIPDDFPISRFRLGLDPHIYTQYLLQIARDAELLGCLRSRRDSVGPGRTPPPLPGWMQRPDGRLSATLLLTQGLIWFAYYMPTMEQLQGQPRRMVPALLGELPPSSVRLSFAEYASAAAATAADPRFPYHEPTDSELFSLERTVHTPMELAHLAVSKPLCARESALAYPSSMALDAARERAGVRVFQQSLATKGEGSGFFDRFRGQSNQMHSLESQLSELEREAERQRVVTAQAQRDTTEIVQESARIEQSLAGIAAQQQQTRTNQESAHASFESAAQTSREATAIYEDVSRMNKLMVAILFGAAAYSIFFEKGAKS